MPQMNNLNDDNKNNEPGDRNHFSEYFDSIIEGLKCHATVMGPDHVQRIKEKLKTKKKVGKGNSSGEACTKKCETSGASACSKQPKGCYNLRAGSSLHSFFFAWAFPVGPLPVSPFPSPLLGVIPRSSLCYSSLL